MSDPLSEAGTAKATSLLDAFMPAWSLRQVDRVAVRADPGRAWALARSVDFQAMPFARILFALRTAPERLLARLRGRTPPRQGSSQIEDFTRPGSGFVVLGEEAGREIVVGSVGKFWKPAIAFAKVAPSEFTAFGAPGFGKLAWCLRVDPRETGGSWITFDLRVGATDRPSWRRFAWYWFVIGRFSHVLRRALLRMLVRQLGPAPQG